VRAEQTKGAPLPGPIARPLEVRRAEVASRLGPVVQELLAGGTRFRDLGVEQIAVAAGMVRSTFYAHFRDKTDLLLVLARDAIDDLIAAARPWPSLPVDASEADLAAILREFIGAYLRHRGLMSALAEESPHDRRVRHEFTRLYATGQTLLIEHIVAGQADGAVDRAVDPEPTVAWLLAMLDHGLYLAVRQHRSPDYIERQVAAATRIIWLALYAGADRK
jgi:AcrR family transcriptional regulator